MKKFLKIILIIIIVLIVIILLGALFMPNKTQVQESVVIDAAPEVIFDYVNCLEKSSLWSPWEGVENVTFSDIKCGVGATQEWTETEGNSGKQEIIESKTNEYVKTFLDFGEMGTADAELILEEIDGGTKVTWTFESDAAYPHMRWFSVLMIKPMLKKSYMKGLNNLDSLIINLPIKEIMSEGVKTVEIESQTILSVREVVSMENIGSKMGEFYGVIMQYIFENKLKMTGYPIALWHAWSDKDSDMECAIYVEDEVESTNIINASKSYAGKAAVLNFYGAYEDSPEGWQQIEAYISENGLEKNGVPWDEYITDPMQEPDTAKWLTRIYQPIK